ncbi:MAG: hypothetical protein AB1641_15235 [Thermodesulfobacteriota bacterium]
MKPSFRLGLSVIIALAAVAGVVEYRAGRELDLARQARAKSDHETAVNHYTRSLNWHLPWGSAETAAGEMLELGLYLARRGQDAEAALALSRVRSGLHGARSFYTPRPDLIAQAEPILARLMAKSRLGPAASPKDMDRLTGRYLEIMRQPARPGLGPALAASLGFLLWTGSVLGFVFRFYPKTPATIRSPWRRAWPYAFFWALGFALWLGGLKWS